MRGAAARCQAAEAQLFRHAAKAGKMAFYSLPGLTMQRRPFLGLLMAGASGLVSADSPDAALWRRLQAGGLVLLLRHAATVPGIGDPPGFELGQCSTQRNLSPAGRTDATRLGAALRRHAVPVAAVLSSRWCRCLDTAKLAFGRVQPAPMLDSMFRDDDAASRRKRAEVLAYLNAYRERGNLVLVTHDVNIRALVGQYANQGEMIVVEKKPDGGLTVVGRLSL